MSSGPQASVARRAVAVVVGVLFIVGLGPKRYLASPRWEVWVVGDDNKPLPGIYVRLVYQNYSAEDQSHEITMTTDKNGYVLFQPQYEKASFFRRGFYTLAEARAIAHASFGRHAHVFAFGGGYEGVAVSGNYVADWRGSPDSMESRIVAKPVTNSQ